MRNVTYLGTIGAKARLAAKGFVKEGITQGQTLPVPPHVAAMLEEDCRIRESRGLPAAWLVEPLPKPPKIVAKTEQKKAED